MFRSLEASTELATHVWPVIERFVHDPGDWLPQPAVPLGDGRWRCSLTAGLLHREVTVEVGPVWALPDAWVRPVRWTATSVTRPQVRPVHYLPSFTGQLAVRPQSSETIQVVLTGHYAPPWARVGTVLDAVAFQRIAQSSVDAFVTAVADRIRASASLEGDLTGTSRPRSSVEAQ